MRLPVLVPCRCRHRAWAVLCYPDTGPLPYVCMTCLGIRES